MEEYLDRLKAKAIEELEKDHENYGRIERLQARLLVIKGIRDECRNDIKSGRIAEQQLKGAD